MIIYLKILDNLNKAVKVNIKFSYRLHRLIIQSYVKEICA